MAPTATPTSPPDSPSQVARVQRVCPDGETSSILLVGAGAVTVPAAPDVAAARNASRQLDHLVSVTISIDEHGTPQCRASGVTHHHPASTSISLGGAVALAAAGLPTMVRRPAATSDGEMH